MTLYQVPTNSALSELDALVSDINLDDDGDDFGYGSAIPIQQIAPTAAATGIAALGAALPPSLSAYPQYTPVASASSSFQASAAVAGAFAVESGSLQFNLPLPNQGTQLRDEPAAPVRAPAVLPELATQMPDGRQLTFNAVLCMRCQKPVVGLVMHACDTTFHPECFTCWQCGKPFGEGGFIEQEGKPFCQDDWYDLFCPKCHACKGLVKEQAVEALGKMFHPEHFCCFGCGCDLMGKVFKEHGGDPFCETCKGARVEIIAPLICNCAYCHLPIYGEFILINGQKIHPEHYKCSMCGDDLTGSNCHEYQEKRYCEECYLKLPKDVCNVCKKPIIGLSVTAQGRAYHPEHFVCAHCHTPLSPTSFWEHLGRPYCEIHYKSLFADTCNKCNEKVLRAGITVYGKTWHSDCFVCHGCERKLGERFKPWDQKPMCESCYNRLPSKVRKSNEQKVKNERKAEEKIKKQLEKERKKKAEDNRDKIKKQMELRQKSKDNAKKLQVEKAEALKQARAK